MPQAYFTFAKQIFHIEDISLVAQGTNIIEKGFYNKCWGNPNRVYEKI